MFNVFYKYSEYIITTLAPPTVSTNPFINTTTSPASSNQTHIGTQSRVLVLVEKMNLSGQEREDGNSDIVQQERDQRGSCWETKFREGEIQRKEVCSNSNQKREHMFEGLDYNSTWAPTQT